MPQIPDKNLKAMDTGATKGQVLIFDFVSVEPHTTWQRIRDAPVAGYSLGVTAHCS